MKQKLCIFMAVLFLLSFSACSQRRPNKDNTMTSQSDSKPSITKVNTPVPSSSTTNINTPVTTVNTVDATSNANNNKKAKAKPEIIIENSQGNTSTNTIKKVTSHENKNEVSTHNNKLNMNENEIKQINITSTPPIYRSLEITDKAQINEIFNYLNLLTTNLTVTNPPRLVGGGYNINILMNDGTERVFHHGGNRYFRDKKNNFIYQMPYNQAITFNIIVANILESKQINAGNSSILGTVLSLESEAGGRNISCVIKDTNNVTHVIYLENAKIIDSTGNGWMILHENDEIKIFYESSNEPIVATNVYIKKTTK